MSNLENFNFDEFDLDIQTSEDPRFPDQNILLKSQSNIKIPVVDFFKDIIYKITKNNDRIKAIFENIINSKLLEQSQETKVFNSHFMAIQRDVQNDLAQEFIDLDDLYKEMTVRPKRIEHYTIQYTSERNNLLSGIVSEKERMELIFSWEMDAKLEIVIQEIKKIATKLFTLFSELSDKRIVRGATQKQELLFEDSKSLCLIIFDELEETRKQINERILQS